MKPEWKRMGLLRGKSASPKQVLPLRPTGAVQLGENWKGDRSWEAKQKSRSCGLDILTMKRPHSFCATKLSCAWAVPALAMGTRAGSAFLVQEKLVSEPPALKGGFQLFSQCPGITYNTWR